MLWIIVIIVFMAIGYLFLSTNEELVFFKIKRFNDEELKQLHINREIIKSKWILFFKYEYQDYQFTIPYIPFLSILKNKSIRSMLIQDKEGSLVDQMPALNWKELYHDYLMLRYGKLGKMINRIREIYKLS